MRVIIHIMIANTNEFTSETGKQTEIKISTAATAYFAGERSNSYKNQYDRKEIFFHFDDCLSTGTTRHNGGCYAIILITEIGIKKALKLQADERSQKYGQYIYSGEKEERL